MATNKKSTATKKKSTAFDKPVNLSEDLAAIIGKGPIPRKNVTKKIWEYIKKNKLQDEKNKRMIKPDTKLSKILGSKPIDMFKMTAKVSKHVTAAAA